jgi:hypothetical protein
MPKWADAAVKVANELFKALSKDEGPSTSEIVEAAKLEILAAIATTQQQIRDHIDAVTEANVRGCLDAVTNLVSQIDTLSPGLFDNLVSEANRCAADASAYFGTVQDRRAADNIGQMFGEIYAIAMLVFAKAGLNITNLRNGLIRSYEQVIPALLPTCTHRWWKDDNPNYVFQVDVTCEAYPGKTATVSHWQGWRPGNPEPRVNYDAGIAAVDALTSRGIAKNALPRLRVGFEVPGGVVTQDAPAAATLNNVLYAFHRGTNDLIYYNTFNGTAWSGVVEVPGAGWTQHALSASAVGNVLYLTATGGNGRLYINRFSAGTWTGWSEIPGGALTADAPTAATHNNRLYVFHRGTNDAIYFSSSNGATWTPWLEVPTGGRTQHALAAATLAAGSLYLTATGLNNTLYINRLSGTTWTGWSEIPGNELTADAPATAADFNKLYVYHRGIDDRLYVSSWSNVTSWTHWVLDRPGGALTRNAPGVAAAPGGLYAFHRGSDDHIYIGTTAPA